MFPFIHRNTLLAVAATFLVSACSKEESAKSTDSLAVPKSIAENLNELAAEPGIDGENKSFATLRNLQLAGTKTPPRMMPLENKDLRIVRNYPEQPPIIPHKIDSYQVDKNHNQCLDCHARGAVDVSQAPMVSVTHFMNRDGQVLSSISARRYYCNQCHVPQHDVRPLIDNEFVDADEMIKLSSKSESGSH